MTIKKELIKFLKNYFYYFVVFLIKQININGITNIQKININIKILINLSFLYLSHELFIVRMKAKSIVVINPP